MLIYVKCQLDEQLAESDCGEKDQLTSEMHDTSLMTESKENQQLLNEGKEESESQV